MALNLRPSFELIETYNFYIEQANKSQAFRLREQRLATLAGILSAGLIVTGAVLLSEGSVTENTGLTVAGSLGLGAGVGLIPRPFAHLRDASAAAARERRSLANAAALGLTPVNPDLQ